MEKRMKKRMEMEERREIMGDGYGLVLRRRG